MKKIIFLLVLLASGTMVGQGSSKYQRLGKLTTTEINAIPVTNTHYTYTAFNTTLGIEVINKGRGWTPRIPAGDFSTLTGSPYDNTNLTSALNAKAAVSSFNNFSGANTFSGRVNFTGEMTMTGSAFNLQTGMFSSGKLYNGTSMLQGTVITTAPSSMATITFMPTGTPRYLSATASDITYNGTSLLAGSSFTSISGNPSDNTNLKNALDNKANDSNVVHKTGSEEISGSKTFHSAVRINDILVASNQIYQGRHYGVSGKRWLFGKEAAYMDGDFKFMHEESNTTSYGGSYSLLYKLNRSGTPADSTDLITKGYADSNYGGTNGQTMAAITNTPSGGISATNGQSAITELDAEKLSLTGGTMEGSLNIASSYNISMGGGLFGGASRVSITNTSGSSTITSEFNNSGDFTIGSSSGQSLKYDFSADKWYLGSDQILASDFILDEDNMGSDSNTKIPTQQSVKAYVDTAIASGSSGGASTEQAERINNAGLYLPSTASSNETLSSAIVKPATAPNRGKRAWRTYTANDTIKIPDSLPNNWPFVLEAGASTDSILVTKDNSERFYGEGNTLVKSNAPVNGFWIPSGKTVAVIKKATNLFWAGGQWNVATLFPPTGTLITNGGFDSSTGWETPLNGASIADGVGKVTAGSYNSTSGLEGALTSASDNWSLRQNSVFATDGTTTYTVRFKARATGGTTGHLEIGRGYALIFNTTVPSSWTSYEVTAAANTNSWSDDLSIGALSAGDTFEIDEISVVAN